MKALTSIILTDAAEALLQLGTGTLAAHVGAAFDSLAGAYRCNDIDPVRTGQMLTDIKTELHALGLAW